MRHTDKSGTLLNRFVALPVMRGFAVDMTSI
jgi:hypothetical protein